MDETPSCLYPGGGRESGACDPAQQSHMAN